jgi:NhaP-type Na+/H+ or K+/H+ antiporter
MDLPTPHRYTVLTTTCMIVLFTTLVFGSSTPLLLKLLKLLNIPTGVEEPTDDERLDDGGGGECEIRPFARSCAATRYTMHTKRRMTHISRSRKRARAEAAARRS